MRPRNYLRAAIAALTTSGLLYGCGATRHPAPVSERGAPAATPGAAATAAARDADSRPELYVVKAGDTLHSIALDHGLDYRELAEWNGLSNVNLIRVGQRLRLRAPGAVAVTAPVTSPPAVVGKPIGSAPATAGGMVSEPVAVKVPYSDQAWALMSKPAPTGPAVVAKSDVRPEEKSVAASGDDEKLDWAWPTGGKLLTVFNENTNLKGIGIAGKLGQPVLASAPGKVLYSGDGIRGYGKLIIIKHNNAYLSVYAHNSVLAVKEGQSVVKGQKIAEMGNTDADQVKLHFEIRRYGKPVDPSRLLPPAPA